MKENKNNLQGTPRTDNPNIKEWFGPKGKVLQLVKLAGGSSHYRMTDHRQDTTYYSTKRYSLRQMLAILNY